MASDLADLQERQEEFIKSRGWEQFHTPKSIAMALSVEVSELGEIFQWHDNLPPAAYQDHTEISEAVEDELADVVIYSLSMAIAFDLDLTSAVERKMDENTSRFDGDTASEIKDDLEKWSRSNNK
jgi:NTP pyrophosphatase (non-canonical NTP hydrolase)